MSLLDVFMEMLFQDLASAHQKISFRIEMWPHVINLSPFEPAWNPIDKNLRKFQNL